MSSGHLAIPFDELVEYWLGETDPASTDAIDEHLLGCDVCGAQLDEIASLGRAVREAFDAGLIGAFLTAGFVRRLAERARVREYRVPHNGSVDCGIAPSDDFVVSRLQVPLAGVQRLDAVISSSLSDGEQRLNDIPFDAESGEVLFVPKPAPLRQLPAYRRRVRVLAVDADGERAIGEYTLNHSPWPQAQ